MRFSQKRRLMRKQGGALEIAPLIDVVFLLLIFFISTSKMSDMSSGLSVKNLPKSRVVDKVKEDHVVVTVFKNRTIKINGKEVKVINLDKVLSRHLSKSKNKKLIITSNKQVDIGFVVSIIGRAKVLGYKEVNIAAIQEGK